MFVETVVEKQQCPG